MRASSFLQMLVRSEATPFWLAQSCRGPPSPALPPSTCHQPALVSRQALCIVRGGASSIVSRGCHLLHEETIPLHEETVPLHEETIPLHEKTISLHEETIPLHEDTISLHEETSLLHEETVPLHGKLFHYMRRVRHRNQRPTIAGRGRQSMFCTRGLSSVRKGRLAMV